MNANAKEVIGRINGVDEKLISERPGMYSPQVSVNVNEKYTVSFNKPWVLVDKTDDKIYCIGVQDKSYYVYNNECGSGKRYPGKTILNLFKKNGFKTQEYDDNWELDI